MRYYGRVGSLLLMLLGSPLLAGGAAGQELTNPFLGQPEAITAGRTIYASKCYV